MSESDYFEKIDILLVDDRQTNLLSLEAVLACPEYNLIKTSSGDEALRYLLDHTPALILMDVQMPELNGFETASIIKGSLRTREIPIIFVTAINKDEKFTHEGYNHGAVDYIYKPYDAHVLKAKVAVFADIMRQHTRISRLVSVQRAATQALAESNNMDAAIANVLKSVCTSLKWDFGIFWKLDKRTNALCSQSEWHDPIHNASDFITESFKRRFHFGIGLPGKIWATKKALWITEVQKEADFSRLKFAVKSNLHTAVALPAFVQDETLGVFEFYSQHILPEDPDLVNIMGAIGSQVGQVLKRAEAFELVRISEARKAAILETALDCIISMDHEGKIIEFNPAAETTFQRSRAEVIGKKMAEVIIPPAFRESHSYDLNRYFTPNEGQATEMRIEVKGMRADGSTFPMELAITRVPEVDPPLFTCFLRDITKRKRIENNSAFLIEASTTLASSLNYEETFSAIAHLAIQSLADWCSIDVIGEDGELRSVAMAHPEPSALEFTDWNSISGASDVIRSGKSELYPNFPHELGLKSAMIIPLIARTKTLGAITFISSKSKRRYTAEDLIVAEELARRAAIAIDNAKLYQNAKEAIRARDDFFSIASHELKTPITALKMMIQLTQRGVKPAEGTVPSAEKLSKMLDKSTKQVDRLTHLVEDLLDVVKIRAGKFSFNLEELDLSKLVEDVVEQYSGALATAKCPLEVKLSPGVIGVWDRTRIEQIIGNLISNALKYASGKPIQIEVSGDSETAKLIVRDFGPGIPLDQQTKIFERFERAITSQNITGLGLGLFIVKQIVEAHRGSIFVDSAEGKGSTFTVALPTKNPDASLKKTDEGIRTSENPFSLRSSAPKRSLYTH